MFKRQNLAERIAGPIQRAFIIQSGPVAENSGQVLRIEISNGTAAAITVTLVDGIDANGNIMDKIVVPVNDVRELQPYALSFGNGLYVAFVALVYVTIDFALDQYLRK